MVQVKSAPGQLLDFKTREVVADGEVVLSINPFEATMTIPDWRPDMDGGRYWLRLSEGLEIEAHPRVKKLKQIRSRETPLILNLYLSEQERATIEHWFSAR